MVPITEQQYSGYHEHIIVSTHTSVTEQQKLLVLCAASGASARLQAMLVILLQ
jgi:hypothetical protein